MDIIIVSWLRVKTLLTRWYMSFEFMRLLLSLSELCDRCEKFVEKWNVCILFFFILVLRWISLLYNWLSYNF